MNKKKLLFIILYILLVGVIYCSSSTLSKYTSNPTSRGNFIIGKKLYFQYKRGDLYRNDQLIVGIPIEDYEYDGDGHVVSTTRRIETMNVAPGDNLTYHFLVSNYNSTTSEQNGVDGVFHVSASSLLSMPVHQANYRLNCTIAYRELFNDGTVGNFKDLTSDVDLDLEVYDGENPKTYEFKVFVILDDQITATSNDDYIGASLTISLFVDAADRA